MFTFNLSNIFVVHYFTNYPFVTLKYRSRSRSLDFIFYSFRNGQLQIFV